ncbi:MAG: DUF5722 domain-containing protein [Phycisphaeraceae bacterium]
MRAPLCPPPYRCSPLVLFIVGLVFTTASLACNSVDAQSVTAAADRNAVTLTLDTPANKTVRVYSLAPDATLKNQQPVYEGLAKRIIRLPRAGKGGDPLFRQFIVHDDKGNVLAGPTWVSDVSKMPKMRHPMPWPEQIKGVSNPEDFNDLVELGVKHVHVNFILSTLLLPDRAPDPPAAFIREVHGQRIRINPATIKVWDAKLKRMTDDGINVVAVLLNRVPNNATNKHPLVHPDTDIEGAPHKLGAFNLDNDKAVAAYTGAIGFLAERYSRADKRFGWIGGYIVGNEVDSHWVWHNMGPSDLETVASHYIKEVRLAWLAIREQTASPRVFISLTHSWARPNAMDPLRSLSGKDLLVRLTQLSQAQGDFEWEVAYHPYPQNLFQPKFWEDRLAMFGYDSPMITFKNIELLPAYLNKPEMQYRGKRRPVILSEQGLHTPKGPDGETIQAAALALAMHRIKHTPGIDAFILHRHIDSRQEGGLLLGLRHPREIDSAELGGKKKSWHVFKQFETPKWEEAAKFSLKLAGYENWKQAEPKTSPFPEIAPEWAGVQRHTSVLFDLTKSLNKAKLANALAVRQKIVNLPDGGFVEAILLHPKQPESPNATALFEVKLPKQSKPVFRFKTYREKTQGDGVVFRVRVDDAILFQKTVEDQAMLEHSIDLSKYAGKTIQLTLEVGPRRNNNYDSALWLNPAIVDTKK